MNNLNSLPSQLKPYEIMPLLQEKVYKAKDLGVSSRTIYNWKENKILFGVHDDKEKNMMLKFSLAEYFWIRIIQQCRDYGMNLEQIKAVKKRIIDTVRSYDSSNQEEKHEQLIKDIRESCKGKSEAYIQGQIDGALKYIHHVEVETKNYFEDVLFAVVYNRKPSGIIIYNEGDNSDTDNKVNIDTDIYIEKDKTTENKTITMFYRSHLFISFDRIFVELGLSDHFKQKALLSDDEIKSIEVIRRAIKSKSTNKIEIEKKGAEIKKIRISLNKPKNAKEVEEYKKKLGKNLEYKTTIYNGEMNLFDFHYTLNTKINK